MPMGVVNDTEFEQEVQNSGIPLTGNVVELPKPGRKEGDVNVPDSLRKIIGETSELEGRQSALDLATSLGISPSSVSAYSNGATSTATYNKPTGIKSHLTERKSKVANTALSRLTRAMSALTTDKISESSAREISAIAKDMAQVVKMMDDTPSNPNGNNGVQAPQFLVYAPTMIDERKFEVIQAKE